MTFFEKIKAQWNRLNPSSPIAADASEAEMLDAMEQSTPAHEIVENSTVIQTLLQKVEALEQATPPETPELPDVSNFVTTEVLTQKITEINTAIKANETLVGTTKTALATEISKIKTLQSGEVPPAAPPAPPTPDNDASGDEGDDDSYEINMKDLFQGETVPGLIA